MHNADADAAEALAARPTEAPLLCSENVSQELRQTRASHEEKQRMLEILQRVHDADTAVAAHPASGGCRAYPHLTHPSDISASGGNGLHLRRRKAAPCSRASAGYADMW